MLPLVKANLAHHSRRYVATLLAVAISVAFVAASLVFGGALNRGIRDQVAGDYEGVAAVVTLDYGALETQDEADFLSLANVMDTVEGVPGVTQVYPMGYTGFEQSGSATSSAWIPTGIVEDGTLRVPRLERGEMPSGVNQALVSSSAAERLGVDVGSTLSVNDVEGTPHELQVVGVTANSGTNIGLRAEDLLVGGETMRVLAPEWEPSELLVAAGDKPSVAQQQELVSAIDSALEKSGVAGIDVETGSAAVDEALGSINASQAGLTIMLLLFPVISAAVAMIVVGTTFQVIFRQREREMALLRVVGATGKQVRRLMVLESGAVGLIGSAVGVFIGVFGGAGIASGLGVVGSYGRALASVSITQALVVIAVGTLLTLLAGLRPALHASRVSPVTALAGQVSTVAEMGRKQVIIGIISGVFTVALAVVTALGAFAGGSEDDKLSRFPLVLLGAVLTVSALIVFLSAVIPLLTRAVGRLGRSEGIRLAAANTARAPGRTAATGIAIFIGVALISMVTLGAQSLRVTASTTLDASAPVDLVVTAPPSGFTPEQVAALLENKDADAAVVALGAPAKVSMPSGDGTVSNSGVLVDGTGLDAIARNDVSMPEDGQITVPEWQAATGDQVEVCVNEECRTLTAVVDNTLSDGTRFVVNGTTAEEFAGALVPMQAWMKLAKPDSYQTVVGEIQEMGPDLGVDGSVALRAAIDQIVNILVMVVVALLAVSVLVSLVGVTNTLSLSVAERTKENGLLRALGMTKKQVRAMLAWEALLIAGVSTAVGLLAGAYFGIVGFMSLPIGTANYVIAVPWGQWAVIVAVAVLAALAASVLPGRKASSVSPVEALAAQ